MDAHTLKHKQRKDWGNEQCAQHQHTLEKVRPAHGRKTAQEGIADDDDGGKIHRRRLVHTGHSVKEGAACLHTGGGVHGVSHQEYHRADDLQGLRFGQEPVGQVLGDGDGVIGHNGEPPQPGCLHEPADGVANGQTHRDPHLPHAQGVDRGRQTHEYPRAHVGGAGGQSRDPRAHLAAAQEIGLLAAVTAELLAIYGLTLGWRRLKVRQVRICFPTLPAAFDGYRLLHLSDFHLGTFGRHNPFVRRVIETANQQEADLVVFTGDLVNKVAREAVPYRHDLAMLQAPDGVFAILGNHDYCKYGPKRRTGYHDRNFQQLGQVVRNVGWTLLLDEHRILQRGNDRIAIAGVENIGRPPFPVRGDLEKAVRGLEPDTFTILLSHDPNHWRAEVVGRKDIALTLAGHTHGAQVRIGPLSLARFAFKEWGGLYHKGAQWLYVSLGLGGSFPFRLGAWPEMTVIELGKE